MEKEQRMRDRGIVAVDPGDVEWRPLPRRAPGAREVAGETLTSLISPGTELAVAFSDSPYPRPIELGYSAVLRITEVGGSVQGISPGDLVLSFGHHASWQVLPEAEVFRLPPDADPLVVPFARMMHIGLAGIATSQRLHPGATVGVSGLGLIGQLSARVAAASGYEVVAADASPERRALAGAAALEKLPLDSCDLVLECSGREERVVEAAEALRSGGELVLAGVPWRPRSDARLFDLLDPLFHRYLTVRSGWEWQVPWQRDAARGGPSVRALVETALRLLSLGRVDVTGLAETLPAEAALDGYRWLRERSAAAPTFLLEWSSRV